MSNERYTSEDFRIEVIRYLDEFWQKTDSAEMVAKYFNYTEQHFSRKFSEIFDIPFRRYLKKLKLHRAAKEIYNTDSLGGVYKIAGFANPQSFSKAFKSEFGLSPREFMRGRYEIPDLPFNVSINGRKVKIEYEDRPPTSAHVTMKKPEGIRDDELMRNCGYYFTYTQAMLPKRDGKTEQVGFWWYDENYELYYCYGEAIEKDGSDNESSGIEIPADYYACFSIDRLPDYEETLENIRRDINALTRVATEEWRIINRKNIKGAGYTYERYSGDKISFCIPLYRRDAKDLLCNGDTGPVLWIKYIDEHIMDNLTVASVAEYFNYSESHYRDTFTIYYGVTPGEYIKKRKNYLLAERETESLLEEYRLEDLNQYYSSHKDTVSIRYIEERDIVVRGRNVLEGDNLEYCIDDIVECIAVRLKEDNKDTGDGKFIVWKSDFGKGENTCICGTESNIEDIVYPGEEKILIRGGAYIIMESLQENDDENLVDTYRMLYRCAFYGWIRENWMKVDLQRLTFTRYEGKKFKFYVPVL